MAVTASGWVSSSCSVFSPSDEKSPVKKHRSHKGEKSLIYKNCVTNTGSVFGSSAKKSQCTRSLSRNLSSCSSNTGLSDEEISSSRGRKAVSLLPVYLSDARSVTKYHPITAPEGALQLSVAENQMLEDLLVPALTRFSVSENHDKASSNGRTIEGRSSLFHSDQIYYQPTHGRQGIREAVAGYLEKLLKFSPDQNLDREGLVCGAGCNAVLENLCFCLTEAGDAVLLPTPYYAAFEFDLVARAGLEIVPVNTMAYQSGSSSGYTIPSSAYYPNKLSLDASYEKAKATGLNPKVLLLSHPNNPLGICYPPYVIKECIEWAIDRKVHLISDEIYAGSVHMETNAETGEDNFHSTLTLAAECESNERGDGLGLSPYIHFVYALSKDFAVSGLRVGISYSENQAIRLPMQKLNDLCQISSQTQVVVESMLSSKTGVDKDESLWSTDFFLPQNRERIRHRCHRLQQCLTDLGIPFLNATSGIFLWMDLTEFLPQQCSANETVDTDQRERVLYLELLHKFGLLFTPGLSMRNEMPGFFRCVFTAASEDEFELIKNATKVR